MTKQHHLQGIPYNSSAIAASTTTIVTGAIATAMLLPGGPFTTTFRFAAIAFGVTLAVALLFELKAGVKSLFRIDVLMLTSLYALTLLEFVMPVEVSRRPFGFNAIPTDNAAVYGTQLVLLAFALIAVGRHAVPRRGGRLPAWSRSIEISDQMTFKLFLLATCVGYFHIAYAVSFDVIDALRQMSLPRFSQSWQRGKLGNWSVIAVELGALIYLIPPLAGLIFAQRRRHTIIQLSIVAAVLAVTMYSGFAGGTRNVFILYVVTFLGTFLLFQARLNIARASLVLLPMVAITAIASTYMLEFRKVGLSNFEFNESSRSSFVVDYNLLILSRLTDIFPERHAYLGLEIPYNAVIRPIPRVLWPSKPEGLSISIEEALGARGLTISTTFVGEAYMSAGIWGVAIAALLLGTAAGNWNRLSRPGRSRFELLLYVSGFLVPLLGMRSLMSAAPLALPALGLWFYGKMFRKSPSVGSRGGKHPPAVASRARPNAL